VAPTAFAAATQIKPATVVVEVVVLTVVVEVVVLTVVVDVVVLMVVMAVVVVVVLVAVGACDRQSPTVSKASWRLTTRDKMHRVCSSNDSSKRSLLQPPMTLFVRLNQAATDFQPYSGVLKNSSSRVDTMDS